MDEKLLLLINREWTNPALDRLMAAASSFGAWAPVLALLVLLLLWRGDFRLRAFIATAVLAVGVNDGLVARTLKRTIDRPRPHQSHNDVRIVDLAKASPRLLGLFKPVQVKFSRSSLEDVEGRSFPSSHTMNTLAVALTALAFYGRRGVWVLILPILVSYSRIYTGSHWPSDVVTSWFLGAASTLFVLALVELLWRKRAATWFPALHAQHPALFAA